MYLKYYKIMKTFSKAELIKDYNELDDRSYENSFKKELAEKYNTSKKIKDIQVAILEELRKVRSHSIVFDNDDIVFFNRLDGKFKDNVEKESISFILFLKDFLTERMKSKNLFDKIGMHTKRDWNFIMSAADKYLIEKYVTIEKYLESRSEKYKIKNQKIEEIFTILVDSTQDFYRFYINRATEQAERIYCNAESSITSVKNEFEKLQNDMQTLNPQANDAEISFDDEIITSLNKAYSLRDELTTSIKLKRENRMSLFQDNERKEQQLRQIRKDLNDANNRINNIKISQAKSETKLETNLNRLASEYQMTYEFAQTKVTKHIDNAKEEVLQLRREIEALGNINMNAPEEYEEVNNRYEFLSKQIDELIDSKNKILKAIDEMDVVMTKQFKAMFNAINNELNETFRSLFGGGKAKLILEDASDILNTGIDIDVQPPGKAVQNIRLFSGGEKALIAICVIFSILKVKPVPLIIFDEVEAALDQSNVERFAKYLKTFIDQTQFIVVTHRPGTMQECEVLYGVTMQKQGVSQMLKVELYDAIEMADDTKEGK